MASRIATGVASRAASRILLSTTGTRFRNQIQASVSQVCGTQLPQLVLRNNLVASRILGPAVRLRLRQPQRFTAIPFSKRLFIHSMRFIHQFGRRAVFNYGIVSTIGYGSRKFWERFLARTASYDAVPYSPLWLVRQLPGIWFFLSLQLFVLWTLGWSYEEESVAVREKKREQSNRKVRAQGSKDKRTIGEVKISI